ncbi:D-Tagatose 3-epimerase [Lentisphaera araneosa HTCC2155]|uniref:D-Tagatose 3-epimerase n=1 Tax=Lentisphaera araneosa HTCC2155 TaxID=313628 RepID=A6DJL3_9BACT|nr:sugar phosphate isomerase/epimerase family protein [Lentisphaera araneosa]EDM28087.1 D-Tagatose 3-epimerase [Lentisphaera araneosa HTCC2155]
MNKKNKVGINMMLWTPFVEEKHFPIFNDLKNAGYDGVEIPLFEGDLEHYKKVKEALDDLGLECTTSTACLEDRNLISPDEKCREAALQHLKWAVDCSAILGSEALCGPFHSAPGVLTGKAPSSEEMNWAIKGLRELADYAKGKDVLLTIEYLNRFESHLTNTLAQTVELVEAVGADNLGIHYDTHHAHLEEYSLSEAIQQAGKHIKHVQYSESNRGIPGQGQVNWQENTSALKEIGYEGWVVIEAFTQNDPGIVAALHLWRPLFSSEREVYDAGIALVKKFWS